MEGLSKSDLSPFSKVKAKNGEFGILVIFEESEIVCFKDVVIFLSRYNDDLTLGSLDGMSIEGTLEAPLREYRYKLLEMKERYYGYEIVEIYKLNNFNDIRNVINFDYLKSNF